MNELIKIEGKIEGFFIPCRPRIITSDTAARVFREMYLTPAADREKEGQAAIKAGVRIIIGEIMDRAIYAKIDKLSLPSLDSLCADDFWTSERVQRIAGWMHRLYLSRSKSRGLAFLGHDDAALYIYPRVVAMITDRAQSVRSPDDAEGEAGPRWDDDLF